MPVLPVDSPPDLDTLASCALFKNVERSVLRSLLDKGTFIDIHEGDILIEPGDENHDLYLLLTGNLRVFLDSDRGLQVEPEVGFPIAPGECIGEMSIIEHKPVSAYVRAEADCRLLVINEQTFWDELIPTPGIVKNLLQDLSSRMRRLDRVALQTIEERLKLAALRRDLEAAAQIQSNILPHGASLFVDRPQVDVAAKVIPARAVGGDFFDAFPLDDRSVCIAIGDVSGKGIPAALFMIRAITLLRLQVSNLNCAYMRALGATMESINRNLCESNERGMFVTLFVGLLDLETGELIYCNGGHNPPFVERNGRAFELLDVPPGMLLGISDDTDYPTASITLQPGDRLVAYTDGVTEARDRAIEFFGEERALDVLQQMPADASAQLILNVLQRSVFDFADGEAQSDDITILALRYRGQP
ncbi:MAG: PP2C family protein-serine/threonine phosphatase [Geitlerinemataceae cyanobacterium]